LISLIGRLGQVSAAAPAPSPNDSAMSAAIAAPRKSLLSAIATSGIYRMFTRTAMRALRP
jgi:hypothetical protein